MKTLTGFAAALLALVALEARATHHLWKMTEIYSNADGTVQYLVFNVERHGEHLLATHPLTSITGRTTQVYTFPNHLPEETTGGRDFLVGTEGFAALGIVTPDYVVPNGFFSAQGGLVDFASLDLWTYPPLPDGTNALRRDGTIVRGAPSNFAGAAGRLPEAAAFNVQGLWWRSPANSEPGWGLNIAHQGDVLFATWFTYDADGTGQWLVASEVRKTGTNTYAGKLHRTTGPRFDAVPFDGARVTVAEAGNVTLTFTDENNGTFAYTVGSVSQSKAITRQVFAAPVPRCTPGAPGAGAANYQGLWWRSTESGWGLNVTHQGDILFVTWFTYGAGDRGQWFVMTDARLTAPGTYAGTLYRTQGPPFSVARWDSVPLAVTAVGTATLTFAAADRGTFAYTVDGVSQTKPITPQSFASPATSCR